MQIKQIREFIRSTGGKFFTIEFYKRTTGELRTMLARTGVSKNVTGEGLKFSPRSLDLKVVYSVNDKGYRMVNLRGVRRIVCGNRKLEVA